MRSGDVRITLRASTIALLLGADAAPSAAPARPTSATARDLAAICARLNTLFAARGAP